MKKKSKTRLARNSRIRVVPTSELAKAHGGGGVHVLTGGTYKVKLSEVPTELGEGDCIL